VSVVVVGVGVEVVEETEEGEENEEEEEGSAELDGGALEVVDDALVDEEVICMRVEERICYCASVGVSDCVCRVCVCACVRAKERERVCVRCE